MAFHSSLLLVGQGPVTKVYDSLTSKLLATTQIFERNKIHGFSIVGSSVLAWGGRSLRTFQLGCDGTVTLTQPERFHNDWIVYGVMLPSDTSPSPMSILVLTAHNVVFEIEIKTFKISNIFKCPNENSILYSGSIIPLKSKALVAAGTVLSGIVLWDMQTGSVLNNFTSHEGSIFGVRFSNDGNFLLTCSDDRSIKLWDLRTGTEIATGWGHLARIWDIQFYQFDSNTNISNIKIISTSEDCTARVWKVDKNQLVTTRVMDGHLGRNSWCGAINEKEKVLATCGSDGRVRLWDLDEPETVDSFRKLLSVTDASQTVAKKEIFKHFKILGNTIAFTTSAGRIFSWSRTDGKYLEFDSTQLETQKNDPYLIINGWKSIETFVVSYRDGSCLVLSAELKLLSQFNSSIKAKVTDIHTWEFNDKYYLLVQSQNPNDPYILSVFKNNASFELLSQVELKQPSSFLPISVVMIDENTLFMGSRFGAAAYYDISKSNEPLNCWRQIFSSDGITSLVYQKHTNTIHLTSRAGYFGVAEIQQNGDTLDLKMVSSNKLQRGTIEGTTFVAHKKIFWGFRNDLFFIWNETDQYEIFNERCGGSHRNWDVVVYDETTFAFVYSRISQVMVIDLSSYKPKFQRTLLQDGSHGREIRAITTWPGECSNRQLKIVATASEDTCINISALDSQTGQIVTKCILRKHVSGIQALKWSHDGKYLFSSAGREEFYVWKVQVTEPNIDVFAIPVGIMPPSTDVADLRIMDFSVTPIRTGLPSIRYELIVTIYSDSAIRFWVHDRQGPLAEHAGTAVGDGPETTDNNKRRLKLIGTGQYRTCCLLNCDLLVQNDVALLLVSSTDGHVVGWDITNEILGFGGIKTSDVELSIVDDLPDEKQGDTDSLFRLGEQAFRMQTHQSSIKGSILLGPHTHQTPSYYHIGGGDDNSLALSVIKFTDSGVLCEKIFSVESAHSCTITGLAAVPSPTATPRFVTVGVDQNVRLWEVSASFSRLSLKNSRYTTVADTGCVDCTSVPGNPNGLVILGGLGLSYWQTTE